MRPFERARRARFGIGAFVAMLGAVCFVRVLGFGFAYDDHWTILEHRSLGESLLSLLAAILTGRAESAGIPDATRPTMQGSLWVDHRLFGLTPFGYHAHSLVWYALCCALGFWALLSLTRRVRIAAAGGLVFALAPVHAEAVAAINYREDLIASSSVLAVLAWTFSSRAKPETSVGAGCFAAVLLLGLGAKESASAVLALVVGIALLQRRDRTWWTARMRSWLALLGVVVAWGGWRWWLHLRGSDDVPLADGGGLWTRVLDTARYEVRTFASALVPLWAAPEYDPEVPATLVWVLPLIALLAIAFVCVRRPRTKALGLGIAVALLAALPTSPLVGPANPRADRFVFLSVLGGAMIWGWLFERASKAVGSRYSAAALVLALGSLAFFSQRAAEVWRSDLTLWRSSVESAPRSYRSWVGLSRAERLAGELDAAETSATRAIALYPQSRSGHVTRAYARLARGDVIGAREDIQRVRELGGARQRGLARAAHCAELPPERTRECIDGKSH